MKASKHEWLSVAFCMAAALIGLLLCSMNSPLYPLNPWNDVNCYVTVASEMLRGGLPYRDLIEHKGPLMYALHALALWISPGNYHGIWLIEVVLLTGVLIWAVVLKTLCAVLDWTCDLSDVLTFAGAFFGGELALLAFKRVFAKDKNDGEEN